MASDNNRDFYRLAKRYRIFLRHGLSPNEWPEQHRETFENIRKIGNQTYGDYCVNVDIHSGQQPWKETTKLRTTRLAQRSVQILAQNRNEAGWRFGIENAVLARFFVEVACSNCRARLWRSEIEACADRSNIDARYLEERRKKRKPCRCPLNKRSHDYYDIGTNALFDDRLQEVVQHDAVLRSELPKREPDRILGLQATKNIEKLLSKPMFNPLLGNMGGNVGDLVRTSCSRESTAPLLFPFLILEAKAERSPNGFSDIETQTMFPIFGLLKLQEDLFRTSLESNENNHPNKATSNIPFNSQHSLVWFFANRGDCWRLYGCYATKDRPAVHNIVHLWDGCITTNDGALQLLLIVDYISDWARDIYRPLIIRALKSLTIGQAMDEVSLTDDSNIFSLQRDIPSWIQPPPSTVDLFENRAEYEASLVASKLPSDLGILMPDMKLGKFRSALRVKSRVMGLYLDEMNAKILLQTFDTKGTRNESSQSGARCLIDFMTQWDDPIILTKRDLTAIEYSWCGRIQPQYSTHDVGLDEIFYTVLDFATYLSPSWDIVREIAYIALSKTALDTLSRFAVYPKDHHSIRTLPQSGRLCSSAVLAETLDCLRSGSSSQVLFAAITSSSYLLYPLPLRQHLHNTLTMDYIELGRQEHSRVIDILNRLLSTDMRALPSECRPSPQMIRRDLVGEMGILFTYSYLFEVIRVNEAQEDIPRDEQHETTLCVRCNKRVRSREAQSQSRSSDESRLLADGIVLIISLKLEACRDAMYDICLFSDESRQFGDNSSLANAIEGLLQTRDVYQTIRHPLPHHVYSREHRSSVNWRESIWNLPRLLNSPNLEQQQGDIRGWIRELQGESRVGRQVAWDDVWHQWKCFHLLLLVMSYERPRNSRSRLSRSIPISVSPREEGCSDWNMLYTSNERDQGEISISPDSLDEQGDLWNWSERDRAPKLRIGDGIIRNYHGSRCSI